MRFLSSDFLTGFGAAFVGWAGSFIAPIVPFLVFTGVLVFADLLTGTIAAHKRREQIHWRGFKRTVEKLVLYFVAILLGEGFEVAFSMPFDVAYVVAFPIAITELKSNLENVEDVTGVGLWTMIKERMRSDKK